MKLRNHEQNKHHSKALEQNTRSIEQKSKDERVQEVTEEDFRDLQKRFRK
jgi:hypothetical protein